MKVKVKEEAKECVGFQQISQSSTPTPSTTNITTVAVTSTAVITTNTSTTASEASTTTVAIVAPASTTSTISSTNIVYHPGTPTGNNSLEPLPVDLDLKTKSKVASKEVISTREDSSEALSPPRNNSQHANGTRTEYKSQGGGSRSSDNESPLPSQSLKPETDENRGRIGDTQVTNDANTATSGLFVDHSKLKRILGTLVQFATDISAETGDTVRALILALLSGSMTAEEFHAALQEATNYPLRGFVLPYLKDTLPSLQRNLNSAARANNQTCAQYLRSNESTVLEVGGLVPSGESVEVFGDHGGNGHSGGNGSNYYAIRSNSNPNASEIQHGNNNTLQHYSGTTHAPKRRASDSPHYENGGGLDDTPIYGKRSSHWRHHHQQQQLTESYCWYHPLHSSGGTIQSHSHAHGHGPSPVPPNLVQINQSNAFGSRHMPQQQPNHGQTLNGTSSLDDEWENIHVMLNCILRMVEKTKRAVDILQRRRCSSPVAAPSIASNVVSAQNGNANSGNPSINGSSVESATGDREGNLKRLSGEIVAQTIRATEDRVAEVKRRAEEAVLEVKRAAVAEVQRAVAVAVAESRANERLRVHRYLDLPVTQRNHSGVRQSSFVRLGSHGTTNSAEARPVSTPTTTSISNSISSSRENEKDPHLTSIIGSSCWNCGRPALETCGGCGIARYCGSFCQHRDWEAGGHHATCSNSPTHSDVKLRPPAIVAATGNSVDAESDGTTSTTSGAIVSKGK